MSLCEGGPGWELSLCGRVLGRTGKQPKKYKQVHVPLEQLASFVLTGRGITTVLRTVQPAEEPGLQSSGALPHSHLLCDHR